MLKTIIKSLKSGKARGGGSRLVVKLKENIIFGFHPLFSLQRLILHLSLLISVPILDDFVVPPLAEECATNARRVFPGVSAVTISAAYSFRFIYTIYNIIAYIHCAWFAKKKCNNQDIQDTPIISAIGQQYKSKVPIYYYWRFS